MQAALQLHSPTPSMPTGGSQGELSGTGPSVSYPSQPVERPAPRPQHKVVPRPGCPDNRVGLPKAWVVYGSPVTGAFLLSFTYLVLTVPSLQGKEAWVSCPHQTLSIVMV